MQILPNDYPNGLRRQEAAPRRTPRENREIVDPRIEAPDCQPVATVLESNTFQRRDVRTCAVIFRRAEEDGRAARSRIRPDVNGRHSRSLESSSIDRPPAKSERLRDFLLSLRSVDDDVGLQASLRFDH